MKKLQVMLGILIIGFTSSSSNAQTNVSGVISSNTTWTKGASPYIVTGNLLVNNGVTLTIQPGVVVRFDSALSMQIDGTLLAQGTSNNEITFTSNTADTAGAWGYIYFSDASTDAVFQNSIYGDYVSGSILEYCTIQYAGGASVDNNGAVRLNAAHPFVNHCTVSNNSATGITAYNLTGNLKISNSTISNNTSPDNGGGVYIGGNSNASSNTLISGDTITHNGSFDGGGIIDDPSGYNPNLIITNNIISYNTASNVGGGIRVSGGLATISDNVIMNNSASYSGGGVADDGDTVVISHNAIINNIGDEGGGGIAIITGTAGTIHNNIIADNISSSSGGGISHSFNTTTLLNNHIIRNTALDDAGMIILSSGNSVYFSTNTIAYNKNIDFNNNLNTCIYINNSAVPGIIYTLDNNNIFNNSASYELFNGNAQGTPNIAATGNWWGTANDSSIQAMIHDWLDDNTLGVVDYSPFLSAPDTAAPVSPPANVIKTDMGGGQVQITWNHNPETDIAGYHIYHGGFTGYSFTNVTDVGNDTSYTLTGVSFTDTIAVTAYDRTYSPANELDSTIVIDNMTNGNESWYAYAVDTSATVVSVHKKGTPDIYRLQQNYPNPFNPSTVISYQLPANSMVTLKVYDVLGREVETLVNERQNAGTHSITFDASTLPSGVYFYRLQAGTYSNTKKLLLLK